MPIEDAQYINTLQPDWPDGRDPESGGDDHLRMVKQVLQNTFPSLDAPVTGTPTEINNLTDSMSYQVNGTGSGYWQVDTPDKTTDAGIALRTYQQDEYHSQPNLGINWAVLKMIYPIGSIIINSGQNPYDYLGFGNWYPKSGQIAGVGGVTDINGVENTYSAGVQTGNFRVKQEHIWQITQDVSISDDQGHTHGYFNLDTAGTISEGGVGQGGQNHKQTETGGAHGHTGTVVIGNDTAPEAFINPYYGVYVWVRGDD